MLTPNLYELAAWAHEERVASALLASSRARALDGGPALRRPRVLSRVRCGRMLVRAGAWLGGFDAELAAPRPRRVAIN